MDFSQNNMKFIYLYSQEELNKIESINFNKEYIEKFIPIVLKISSINFTTLLNYYFNTEKYKTLSIEDFLFLENIFQNKIWEDSSIEMLKTIRGLGKIFGIKDNLFNISFLKDIVTPRKVELFLSEILISLKLKEKYNLDIENRIIIAFNVY